VPLKRKDTKNLENRKTEIRYYETVKWNQISINCSIIIISISKRTNGWSCSLK
jgi:hypothetical protein